MKKYINLKNYPMNLQTTRYKTLFIKLGVGEYDPKIADKFPSVLQPVDEVKTPEAIVVLEDVDIEVTPIKTISATEQIYIDDGLFEEKEDLLNEPIEIVNKIEAKVDYSNMSAKELKAIVDERNIEFDGRKTLRNMIIAIKKADM